VACKFLMECKLAVNDHRLKPVASDYGSKPDRSAIRTVCPAVVRIKFDQAMPFSSTSCRVASITAAEVVMETSSANTVESPR